jgi:hypothetical protein
VLVRESVKGTAHHFADLGKENIESLCDREIVQLKIKLEAALERDKMKPIRFSNGPNSIAQSLN